MNESQEKNAKIVTSFCGYGNPKTAKIFFMGIEEHDPYDKSNIDNFISQLEGQLRQGKKYTSLGLDDNSIKKPADGPTERMQLCIYNRIFNKTDQEKENPFISNIHCFNLYPIGAANENDFSHICEEYFGFKNKPELRNYFNTNRAEVLREFIREKITSKKKYLFVFGKKGSVKVRNIFSKEIQFDNELITTVRGKPSVVFSSNDKTIWLTGHPSHRWIDKNVVADIVNSLPYNT